MIQAIEYLLVLFVFLFPWQARVVLSPGMLNGGYWEYGSVSLYATDLLFVLILVCTGLWRWKKRKFQISLDLSSGRRSDFRWMILEVGYIALLLSGYVALSVVWSQYSMVALYSAVRLFQGVVVFYLVRALPIDKSKLIWTLMAGAVAQSILAIAQFTTQTV